MQPTNSHSESSVVQRDHIFISYATEDHVVAEWVARKLVTFGYSVWMDRLKLLGGDRWPETIDVAIKNKSFCMVHLLSRASMTKTNPSNERQMALNIQAERKVKFLILLNLDEIRPSELDWQLASLQYIPFQSWHNGLLALLTTLSDMQCPKGDTTIGQQLAIRSLSRVDVLTSTSETLVSNSYPIRYVPEVLARFVTNESID